MFDSNKFKEAVKLFDKANSQDPNMEVCDGQTFPKELLYAMRMTERLKKFAPNSKEVLWLAVRCQHLCRWEIPRDSYEMNRQGYLKWRNNLKSFHADKASEILQIAGYDENDIESVRLLLLKKQLKRNEMSQTLEDVVCLVFLEYYFDKFSEKYKDEKLHDILKKTWTKMSNIGRKEALKLNLSDRSKGLIAEALH